MKQVILYAKYGCPPCEQIKHYFEEKNIPYETRYVPALWQDRTELYEVSGQCGVPVVIVDGQIIVGPQFEEIERYLGKE